MRGWWLLLAGLAVVSAGCAPGGPPDLPAVKSPFRCDESWPPSRAAGDTPRDWDAAVNRIVGCLPPDEYAVIMRETEGTYLTWSYTRLGLALRNEWIRPESSPLGADLRALGFEYPDDMSAALLSAVWHWVHGRRTDVRARVACVRAWNAEMQRLARSTPLGGRIPDPDFRCDDTQALEAGRARWEAITRRTEAARPAGP
jgi:hypothetical protein